MTRFLIKNFNAEAVVFDTSSCDTHYLSPLAYSLLCLIQSGRASRDLTGAMAMHTEQDAELESLSGEAIESLQRIGLLGPA